MVTDEKDIDVLPSKVASREWLYNGEAEELGMFEDFDDIEAASDSDCSQCSDMEDELTTEQSPTSPSTPSLQEAAWLTSSSVLVYGQAMGTEAIPARVTEMTRVTETDAAQLH